MSTPKAAAANSLRMSRVIKADRERVFRAWTEPEQLGEWFGPEGTVITLAEVDLVAGGKYRIAIESPEGKVHTAHGIYREIEPLSRLVFTWDWDEDQFRMGAETLVTVELIDRGESTEVVITHDGFPDAETKQGHEQGWASSLDELERHLA